MAYKTYRNNHFIGNNQTITACVIRVNKYDPIGGADYRLAKLDICLNGSIAGDINSGLKISNIQVYQRQDETWYLQLPGTFRKNATHPDGKRYDDVRFAEGQFGSLRNYCYDRVNEELDKAEEALEGVYEEESAVA